MIELWLQTAAIFVLAVAYVLMAAKLAGMAGFQTRIERLERYIARLEAAGRDMLIATGKLKPNDRPIAETEWLPPPIKHREIKS